MRLTTNCLHASEDKLSACVCFKSEERLKETALKSGGGEEAYKERLTSLNLFSASQHSTGAPHNTPHTNRSA